MIIMADTLMGRYKRERFERFITIERRTP